MVYLTIAVADQKIRHTWKTTIQETIEGDEKRSAIFTWPRISLDTTLIVSDDEKRRFLYASLFSGLDDIWAIPIVSDKTQLTAEAAAAQDILNVDETDYTHLYAGRECILISSSDWEDYEVVTISGIDSSTQITLSGTLVNTWPVDTIVYPLYDCRIESEQERRSDFYTINSINIAAKEAFEETRNFTYTLPTICSDTYPIYNLLNLFLKVPLNPITERYRYPSTILGKYGRQTYFSTYRKTRSIFRRTFQCNSKEEIYELLDFFDAKQGRFGTFYTPTFMEDIVINAGFMDTDTLLLTKKLYLTEAELVGQHVYIRLKDGSYVCREITAKNSSTSITIDTAVGTTVPAVDLPNTLCSFLHKVRFNEDEILFEYITRTIARTKLGFNIL